LIPTIKSNQGSMASCRSVFLSTWKPKVPWLASLGVGPSPSSLDMKRLSALNMVFTFSGHYDTENRETYHAPLLYVSWVASLVKDRTLVPVEATCHQPGKTTSAAPSASRPLAQARFAVSGAKLHSLDFSGTASRSKNPIPPLTFYDYIRISRSEGYSIGFYTVTSPESRCKSSTVSTFVVKQQLHSLISPSWRLLRSCLSLMTATTTMN
jgi:hypothetical protein